MNVEAAERVPLQHVIVVGGTVAEWAALSDEQWSSRLAELGKVTDHVGASWLTLRPLRSDDTARALVPERTATVGGCVVACHPEPDGRDRLTTAVAALQAAGLPITEASISAALNMPAEADPDLVVVVGAKHLMPPSLVWELAYSELVYVDTSWQHFAPGHLDEAIGSYARRNRRFGGID